MNEITNSTSDEYPLILGVSSCLMGETVRYDGGHKRNHFVMDILARYTTLCPYCPEVAIGLGVPRPPIHLRLVEDEVRLLDLKYGKQDFTTAMREQSTHYCNGLGDLSGYILKSRSPSCGMERVKLFNHSENSIRSGIGLFAETLIKHHPYLPVEEEGRLDDAAIRENFIERIFTYRRWHTMQREDLSVHGLMKFHRSHKFILQSHHEEIYRELGKLVASTDSSNLLKRSEQYLSLFTRAMKQQATRKQHLNVLQHILGFLKKELDHKDKQELLELFDRYARGLVPLIVPITLLRHHLRRHPQHYIEEQYYLDPYPQELMSRN